MKEVVVILELRGKIDIELTLGPLIPALLAWRLTGISKKTLYNWINTGRIKSFACVGVLLVVQNEVLTEVERLKLNEKRS